LKQAPSFLAGDLDAETQMRHSDDMDAMNTLDELMVCKLDTRRRQVEPCTMVIFGASGDLTSRKLIPALYHLKKEHQLPESFRIVGFARREKNSESWRQELRDALGRYSRTQDVEESVWHDFARQIHYCQGDLNDADAYRRLAAVLESTDDDRLRRGVLFYLAISPSQFVEVIRQLSKAELLSKETKASGWQRVVVEKPFGYDLKSAQQLNTDVMSYTHEQQIYRIDHYLGKETVQNILMFRFSNTIFEPLWHRGVVDHVQITVSERLGVGGRGGYYEEAGALRDMVQNHLLQVLALVAMEPPVSLEAESIRDEKVKLLKSVRPFLPGQIDRQAVRGQYVAGMVGAQPSVAYRQESKVNPASNVETYAALRLWIDNWRWSGVPFYLRTGKSLSLSASEVRVQFRRPPSVLFAAQCGSNLDANSITLRLQPKEGINLRFNGKVPGASVEIRPVRMQFSYDSEFGAYTPEAYERLLLEAVAGDATLFIRRDEVETAWEIVDPIRNDWSSRPLSSAEFYESGTWGPATADHLLAIAGHGWRNPQL
jgi:glucose-6-phosphate 1-dehydrogenase